MENNYCKNISIAQKEYLGIINDFDTNDLTLNKISILLDDIKHLWLPKLEIINHELEILTSNNTCVLLSGAIFLGLDAYEHFYFKSMGNYHLISDPLMKIDNLFRVPKKNINLTGFKEYFLKTFNDTKQVLGDYNKYFYILPISELTSPIDSLRNELTNQSFWASISAIFNKEFESEEEFNKEFSTFEEIEEKIAKSFKNRLIFTDKKDLTLNLRKRIERYLNTQTTLVFPPNIPEPRVFLMALYSGFAQAHDILTTCLYHNIIPYIRFNTTMHNVSLIRESVKEFNTLNEMIVKSIIFYVFRKIINPKTFKELSFIDYCEKIKNKSILNNILMELKVKQLDIFREGIRQLEIIIVDEFSKYIEIK